MKRLNIALITGTALMALTFSNCHAQGNYPSRPVKLVVPQAPGGASDSVARMYAEYVSKSIGQPVVIENKPGANGVLASAYVAKQPADGYTMLWAGVSQLAFNPIIYKSLPYNPEKDFAGVSLLVNTPLLLIANPDTGIRSLDDLVRIAKAQPNSLNFASAGRGNLTHLLAELLAQRVGITMTHVPYPGSAPGLMSVMAGQTQLMADVYASSLPQAKQGKVIPLAVIGAQRQPTLPDIPTIAELGIIDFPVPGWYALVVPSGTPNAIIDRLNAETRKFLTNPEIRTKLTDLSLEPLPSAPEAVKESMRREAQSFGPLIRALGLVNE